MDGQVKKFAILGGGGLGVVAPFLDMARFPDVFSDAEIALYDTDMTRAGLMAQFLNLLARSRGFPARAKAYSNMTAAFEGADFMLSRFRPGGSRFQTAGVSHAHSLYQWANDHGYFADDTAAPIAIVMYLEGIATTMQAARELERVAPDAWFLNYTNPTQVVLDTIWRFSSIRAIGLCPGYLNACHDISAILGDVRPDEIKVRAAGVNHHTWVFDCSIRGVNGYELLRQRLPSIQRDKLQPFQLWALETWEQTGYFPTPAGHMQPAFCNHKLMERIRSGLDPHWNRPATQYRDKSAERWEFVRDCVAKSEVPVNDPRMAIFEYNPWLPNLEVDVARAIASGAAAELHLNLPNRGLLPDLPEDAIVEGPVLVQGENMKQAQVGRLNPLAVPVLKKLCDFAKYLSEIYTQQNPDYVLKALESHPATETRQQAAAAAADILKMVSIPAQC